MATRCGVPLLLAIGLTGCGTGEAGLPDPPPSLGGSAWVRQGVDRPGAEGAPEALRVYHPKEWLRSEYRKGAATVHIEIYRMPGETSAFEARQKWLGESGAASMNHGSLFVIARAAPETAPELGGFLRLLEGEWLRAQPR